MKDLYDLLIIVALIGLAILVNINNAEIKDLRNKIELLENTDFLMKLYNNE